MWGVIVSASASAHLDDSSTFLNYSMSFVLSLSLALNVIRCWQDAIYSVLRPPDTYQPRSVTVWPQITALAFGWTTAPWGPNIIEMSSWTVWVLLRHTSSQRSSLETWIVVSVGLLQLSVIYWATNAASAPAAQSLFVILSGVFFWAEIFVL